jgi:hypothetical protein
MGAGMNRPGELAHTFFPYESLPMMRRRSCQAERHHRYPSIVAMWLSLIWEDIPDGNGANVLTVREAWYVCDECRNMIEATKEIIG